jgi:CRISPR-associated endoribonuclease Cas6
MYFVAATIELWPRRQEALTVANSVYAHAAILHTLSEADAAAGQALHDMGRNKRITIALIACPQQWATLRLTFMGQDGLNYANIIVNALSRKPMLRIGKIICDVGAMDLNSSDWSGVRSWGDLMTETADCSMHFTFATPTAIMKHDEGGGRFTSLFPEPLDIFSGLARRWRSLEGSALPHDLDHFLRSGGCVVANYQLQTIEFRTAERTQIGFVGHVVFACRKYNPVCINALNALTRLAFFSGVGYQTARGMGVTRTRLTP